MKNNKRQSARAKSKARNDEHLRAEYEKLLSDGGERLVRLLLPSVLRVMKIDKALPSGPGLSSVEAKMTAQANVNIERSPAIDALEQLIRASAGITFGSILAEMLRSPGIKDYWIRRASSMAGRKGGRPPGSPPHIEWLEQKIKYLRRHGCEDFTARELVDKLRSADEVDGEDEVGNLVFRATFLDVTGWAEGRKEPVITLSAVEGILAKMRKTT